MANREVKPDDLLLRADISQPKGESMLGHTAEFGQVCVFEIGCKGDAESDLTYFVRVEAETEHRKLGDFNIVAALQMVAAAALPGLVSLTLQVGKAINADGKTFQFLVVEFVKGDLSQDVWETLHPSNQATIVAELTEALSKLHTIRPQDEVVQGVLDEMFQGDQLPQKPYNTLGRFDGPYTGVFGDGS